MAPFFEDASQRCHREDRLVRPHAEHPHAQSHTEPRACPRETRPEGKGRRPCAACREWNLAGLSATLGAFGEQHGSHHLQSDPQGDPRGAPRGGVQGLRRGSRLSALDGFPERSSPVRRSIQRGSVEGRSTDWQLRRHGCQQGTQQGAGASRAASPVLGGSAESPPRRRRSCGGRALAQQPEIASQIASHLVEEGLASGRLAARTGQGQGPIVFTGTRCALRPLEVPPECTVRQGQRPSIEEVERRRNRRVEELLVLSRDVERGVTSP
jgi:hypothetical protein